MFSKKNSTPYYEQLKYVATPRTHGSFSSLIRKLSGYSSYFHIFQTLLMRRVFYVSCVSLIPIYDPKMCVEYVFQLNATYPNTHVIYCILLYCYIKYHMQQHMRYIYIYIYIYQCTLYVYQIIYIIPHHIWYFIVVYIEHHIEYHMVYSSVYDMYMK